MENLFLYSNAFNAFLGITFLALFFVLSVLIVVGAKMLCVFFHESSFKREEVKPPVKKKVAERKKIKSIEINPNEVDRIVVKKN